MNNFAMETKMQKCRGATMIEVLVSLFVLAIGLLGVLGMQAEGTQANQRGMFSTQAAFLAQSMADRIRVNDVPDAATGLSAGTYDAVDTTGDYSGGADCAAGDCSTENLLAHDLRQWEADLDALLPDGRGRITWSSPVYTISVIWSERSSRSDNISNTCDGIDLDAGLACYQMEVRP